MSYDQISLAQVNPTVGDFEGNTEKILTFAERADKKGSQAVVFPEMVITGYPPYDLLERPSFIQANLDALGAVVEQVPPIDLYLGYVQPRDQNHGKHLYNACAYVTKGTIKSRHYKKLLPTYDVFSEARYFEPGSSPTLTGSDNTVGISICEDFWNHVRPKHTRDQPHYSRDPFQEMLETKPQLLLNLSASPFSRGKPEQREQMFRSMAQEAGVPLVFCNQVGGNDSLVFDGNSMVFDGKGNLIGSGNAFEEDLVTVDLSQSPEHVTIPSLPAEDQSIYSALKLGLCDYFEKCGFSKAVVGLSGGIDSSLTATIAVDVLGSRNVLGVMMPSQISSDHSVTDAEKLAELESQLADAFHRWEELET